MWTVKNPHLTKQKDRHAATRALLNLCTQLDKETFNIAPLDIPTGRSRKNQFNNSLMSSFHVS